MLELSFQTLKPSKLGFRTAKSTETRNSVALLVINLLVPLHEHTRFLEDVTSVIYQLCYTVLCCSIHGFHAGHTVSKAASRHT